MNGSINIACNLMDNEIPNIKRAKLFLSFINNNKLKNIKNTYILSLCDHIELLINTVGQSSIAEYAIRALSILLISDKIIFAQIIERKKSNKHDTILIQINQRLSGKKEIKPTIYK